LGYPLEGFLYGCPAQMSKETEKAQRSHYFGFGYNVSYNVPNQSPSLQGSGEIIHNVLLGLDKFCRIDRCNG
jgi:hypothetical protein